MRHDVVTRPRKPLKELALASLTTLMTLSVATCTARPQNPGPLRIARQGYIFAGGKYSTVGDRQVMSGQLYAEFQIPADSSHAWPIVMIHGGSQSGTSFTGTPDGR